MVVTNTSEALKKFKRTAWRFQTTFQTPLRDLERFVGTILSAQGQWESGSVTIDQIVFDTPHLTEIVKANGGTGEMGRGYSVAANGEARISELLRACFSDWIDFLFVPMPKPFVIYADHDEFATFFAATKSNLNRVTEPLLHNGFKMVSNYQREF